MSESTASTTGEPASEERYEIKFCAPEAARHRVRRHLSLLPGVLRVHHPPRVVQSLYLDTPARDAFAANRDGDAERTKLRLRWYGEGATAVRGFLGAQARLGGMGAQAARRAASTD